MLSQSQGFQYASVKNRLRKISAKRQFRLESELPFCAKVNNYLLKYFTIFQTIINNYFMLINLSDDK